MPVEVKTKGLDGMLKRMGVMGGNIETGSRNAAMDRAQTELRAQNENMPRTAANKPATLRQKSGSTPLEDTGRLIKSAKIRVWVKKKGKSDFRVFYSIRRKGRYSSKAKSAGSKTDFSKRAGRDLKVSKTFKTHRRRGGKIKVQTGFRRSISVDKVAGIMRSGEPGRGVPKRDYTSLGLSWNERVSRSTMIRNISSVLRQSKIISFKRLAGDIVEIVSAAEGAV